MEASRSSQAAPQLCRGRAWHRKPRPAGVCAGQGPGRRHLLSPPPHSPCPHQALCVLLPGQAALPVFLHPLGAPRPSPLPLLGSGPSPLFLASPPTSPSGEALPRSPSPPLGSRWRARLAFLEPAPQAIPSRSSPASCSREPRVPPHGTAPGSELRWGRKEDLYFSGCVLGERRPPGHAGPSGQGPGPLPFLRAAWGSHLLRPTRTVWPAAPLGARGAGPGLA